MAKSGLILAILVSVMLLVNAGALIYDALKEGPTSEIIEVIKEVPVISYVPINDSNADVIKLLNKEDLWEADAIKIAEEENTNKHIYNALIDLGITDLDDKDDIERIVIKESDVDGDADDKDAEVIQEVRVYYENSVGDNVRVTIEITTEIDEGDVEDVEYALA